MATFGQKLRQAREERNITLAEISATTKIGTRALQALEWERFEQLPGGIFNKGFVRAYARCVGLNEEETVAAYLEASKAAAPETDLKALAAQVEASRPRRRSGPGAATVVAIVAVLVAVAMGGLWLREHRKEAREAAEAQHQREATVQEAARTAEVAKWNEMKAAQAAAISLIAANSAVPTATDPTATPTAGGAAAALAPQVSTPVVTPAAAGKGSPIEIAVKANSRSWISVLRDDHTAETVTLDPADPEHSSHTYKAKDRVKLIMGNPGGLSVTWNGKAVTELGKSGQRSTITFTPSGMQKE